METKWNDSRMFKELSSDFQQIVIGYITGSSLEMYERRGRSGRRISVEKIIDISSCLLCQGMKGLLENH